MKISIQEVKQALKDPEFRKQLPEILSEDIKKYEQNPGCPCNVPFYRNVLKHAVKQLKNYFPDKGEVVDPDMELAKLAENHWTVLNCNVDELEKALKNLAPGRKQICAARWENQVTVIVNELDHIF